jgi:hypothetical protein
MDQSDLSGNFTANRGDFDLESSVLSLFGQMYWNKIRAQLILSSGDFDFNKINRTTPLGPLTRTRTPWVSRHTPTRRR